MTRADCIRELQAEYQQQRILNEQEQDARIEEAGRKDARIAQLREENRDLAFSTMRKLMQLEDEGEKRVAAERMKQKGIENNREIRSRLRLAGFGEDYLDMHYRCGICRDTGLVGDAPSRFCSCFEAKLKMKLYKDSGLDELQAQCFANFRSDIFPEEDGQRTQIIAVRRSCEDYADSFPNTRMLNLMLMGNGGLGKSFLLNCVYERVISRGYPAIRVTAFRMFEAMRRQHMANSAEEMDFDQLISAPLLLIDDLGSEPIMRNISVEYLFTLLNERIAARRHTMLATNLSPVQLKERYGERVSSRLLDRHNCATIMLRGKDLRLL